MKKFLGLLICVLTVVLIGCQNPANNDTPGSTPTPVLSFSEGWWQFSTNAGSTSSVTYLYYDSNKTVSRAGSSTV